MERDGGDTELVVVNPTAIFGPTLTTELGSSMQLVKAMLDGTMSVAPRPAFRRRRRARRGTGIHPAYGIIRATTCTHSRRHAVSGANLQAPHRLKVLASDRAQIAISEW
jgi:hypothetical protein